MLRLRLASGLPLYLLDDAGRAAAARAAADGLLDPAALRGAGRLTRAAACSPTASCTRCSPARRPPSRLRCAGRCRRASRVPRCASRSVRSGRVGAAVVSPRRRLLVAVLVACCWSWRRWSWACGCCGGGPAVDPVARPAQDRPGPVLLVPGYGGSRGSLQPLADRIEATGRTATVLTLAGNGTGDLSAQVALLDRAVDAALAAGAPSVDVVGYSAGGVVAGLWVARDDGAAKARRVVTLGSPLAGTSLAATASVRPRRLPGGLQAARPGQRRDHRAGRSRVGAALPWLSIWTADDETVTPPGSARTAGRCRCRSRRCAPAPGCRTGPADRPRRHRRWCCGPLRRPADAAGTGRDCAEVRAAGVTRSRYDVRQAGAGGPDPRVPSLVPPGSPGAPVQRQAAAADAVAEVVAQVLQVADPVVQPLLPRAATSSSQSWRVGVRPSGRVASTAAISASGIPTRCPIRTSATRRSVSRR